MTISHTDIAIDGTTAWLVGPDYTPAFIATINRPCDTCDGIGSQCLNGHDHADCPWTSQCRDCGGTGRHTFTLDVQCVLPMCVNGKRGYWEDGSPCGYCNASGTRALSVHVVDVLELVESGWFYTVATRGGFSKPTTLPTSAAPGKYAVQIEVHA
jgi:hypothetical protein